MPIVAHNPLSYSHLNSNILLEEDFLMIQQKIGIHIKELRIALGLSQEKFALKIGMDRTYFASVEAGKRNISIKNLEKIVNGLDLTFSDFFSGMEV